MKDVPVIVLALANDEERSDKYLRNLKTELRGIRDALLSAEKKGLCELVIFPFFTIDELQEVLQDERYWGRIAVFHFAGHANSYELLLQNFEGKKASANAEGVAELLGSRKSLKLVFLNGCATKAQAELLVQTGIPCVIGTSQAILDVRAAQLAVSFYKGLGQTLDIAQAWQDAVSKLNTNKSRTTGYRGFYKEEVVDKLFPNLNCSTDIPWHIYPKNLTENVTTWKLDDPLFLLPEIPKEYYLNLPPKPFVHLAYFRKKDAVIFFGRGEEIRDLYNKIRGPYSIILYHGQSGVGKSSLLNAGLVPRLETQYHVLYLRRNEELGLLGTVLKKLNTNEQQLADAWKKIEAKHQQSLILIMDQVEEIFTKPIEGEPLYELKQFLDSLKFVFEQEVKGKYILSYRKEYHPDIRKVVAESGIEYTNLFLTKLSRSGMMEAINGITSKQLLQEKYQLEIETGLPEMITDGLLEDRHSAIAPVLQILLSKLWEHGKKAQKHVFSRDLYQESKHQGILLKDFFKEQIDKLEALYPEAIQSGLVLDILYYHITSLDTAATHIQTHLQERYSHQAERLPKLLQSCKDLYLLHSHEANTYSLSHDILAPIVRRAYEESSKAGQWATKILESKVIHEEAIQKQTLNDIELEKVQEGKNGMRIWTKTETKLIAKSRKVKDQRILGQKRKRQLLIGAGCGILIFGIIAFGYFIQATQLKKDSKAYYLSGKAERIRKENPTHALRLAEAAYAIDSINPQLAVTQTLSNIYHENYYSKFGYYSADMQHGHEVSGGIFSQHRDQILSWSIDGHIKLWDFQGQLLADMPHETPIWGGVFSPDGERILSWSDDGHMKLWDIQGNLLTDMQHKDWVWGAVFSSDGERILSWSRDGHAKLWDFQGQLLADMQHEAWVWGAVFSPNKEWILSWSQDGHVKLWDFQGQLLADVQHEDEVRSATFSSNGNQILSSSFDGLVKLVNIRDNSIIDIQHENEVRGAIFSPKEDQILSWSDSKAQLWDLKAQLLVSMSHEGGVLGALFSPNGKHILSWGESSLSGGYAKLWDLQGQLLADIQHESWVNGATFSPRGDQVLSWSGDFLRRVPGHTKLWDLQGRLLVDMQNEYGAVFSSKGDHILSWSNDGHVKLWNLRGQPLIDLSHKNGNLGAIFSSNGNQILSWVSSYTGSHIKLWDLGGNLLVDMQHRFSINDAILSPKGDQILSQSGSKAQLWDLQGRLLVNIQHEDWIPGAVFSPKGDQILSCSFDGHAKLWDLQGNLLADMPHENKVRGAIFSPKGDQILSWSDSEVQLWDLQGNLLADMQPESRVNGAVFSAKSDQILSWSDSKAQLWNPQGQLLANMPHEAKVEGVIFHPNVERILSWSDNGYVKLWNLQGHLLVKKKHGERVKDVYFSPLPNGEQILSWSEEGHVRLWNLQGHLLADMQHEDQENSIENSFFSPMGERILSWSAFDNNLKLWYTPHGLFRYLQKAPIYNLSEEEKRQYNIID